MTTNLDTDTYSTLLGRLEHSITTISHSLSTRLTLGYIGNLDHHFGDSRAWTVWFDDYRHCWTRPGCNIGQQNNIDAHIGWYKTEDLALMLDAILDGRLGLQHRRLTGHCIITGERTEDFCGNRSCTGHSTDRHYYRTN